jgi:hypothetical protein
MSARRLDPASIAGIAFVLLAAGCAGLNVTPPAAADGAGLWRVYDNSLKDARYVSSRSATS